MNCLNDHLAYKWIDRKAEEIFMMNKKYACVGLVFMEIGTILSCSRITLLSGRVGEFVSAALPWVLLGLGVAFVMAGIAKKEKEK